MTRSNQEKGQLKSIIKETIQELFTDDTFIEVLLKKFSDKADKKLKEMEDNLKTSELKIAGLEKQIEDLQQNEKICNICVYGITEQQNEKLKPVVSQLLNDTQININESDIEKCYRIGKQNNNTGKTRPVIIKFKSYDSKLKILKHCNKFKGKKIFIIEDLVQSRRNLLEEAKKKLGEKNVWSYNGNIFAKIDGSRVKIRNKSDLLSQEQRVN